MATITVGPTGRDFTTVQAAVNAAASGDTIVLDAGVTFTENVELPTTQHASPVVITSSIATIPNRRVMATDAPTFATIKGASAGSIVHGWGVKNWTFRGVAFANPNAHTFFGILTEAQNIGGGAFRNSDSITLDRCVFIGDATFEMRIFAFLNGSNITVDRCHIENVRNAGQESKGFLMLYGPGPAAITDNYIEAASINILFGGGDTPTAGHIPNNITVERNHLYKRLTWMGAGFNVKNLFEIKNGTNAIVRFNLMENCWSEGQNGDGLVLQAVNDAGNSNWNTVSDVVFQGNVVRNVERAFSINGYDTTNPSSGVHRITIKENLFTVNGGRETAEGWIFSLSSEIDTLTVTHNTFDNAGRVGWMTAGFIATTGGGRLAMYTVGTLTFANNLLRGDGGPLQADGILGGTNVLAAHTSGYVWTHNVIAGAPSNEQLYPNSTPTATWFPTLSTHQANFNADYTLTPSSTYNDAGNDALDLGWFGGDVPPGGGEPPPTPQPGVGYGVSHVNTTWSPQEIATTIQHTFDVVTAFNSLLLVRFPYFGAAEYVTGVTTNPNGTGAVSLTKLIDYLGSNSRRVAIWYQLAPTVGPNVITVTMSQAEGNALGVSQYARVHQVRPFGGIVTAGGSGTVASVNVHTGSAYALIIDAVRWAFSEARTAAPAQGQALRFYEVAAAGSDRLPNIPLTTMTWTIDDGGADWAMVGVPLESSDTEHRILIRNRNA